MANEKLSWDADLDENEAVEQQKENDFVLLPKGDYDFTVKKLEKDYYNAKPDSKIPSCPVARVHLIIKTEEGDAAYFRESLFLYSGNKWQLFQFFTCLGLRRHGDGTSKMPWDDVEGSTGRATIGQRDYMKDGEKKTCNTVKKWLDPVLESTGGDGEPGSEDDYE